MKIKTKWNKEYKPINKSNTPSFFERYGWPMKILISILVVLFVIHLFLKLYIKIRYNYFLSNKNNYNEILNNKNSEQEEILYQYNSLSEIDSNELNEIKNFINNNKLLNPDETFKKYENPKISIILYMHNTEQYIEKSLYSIYNQNFREIEIIIIDDFSNDKSQKIIKELMQKFQSISIYRNEINKGLLNSKITGILNARGKYTLFLNPNDFFTKKEAFSLLYEEAEKNNLDILGFSSAIDDGKYIYHYNEIPFMKQPEIGTIMYNITKEGINRTSDVLFNYFIKTELLKQNIMQIDEKYLNQTIIDYNSDFFILYLLSKNASNFKQIKNILYYSSNNWHKKWDESELKTRCLNYIYYIDFLFNKTKDNNKEKKIVIYELENLILNTKCRKYESTRDEAVKISKQLTEKKYVENKYKLELYLFIFENITTISSL